MICKGCGNENAFRMRFTVHGESCNQCGGLGNKALADVYFRQPYLDPHLIDIENPRQKDGVWIESKEHKRQIMDKLNIREAGDRIHGSRPGYKPANGGWQ